MGRKSVNNFRFHTNTCKSTNFTRVYTDIYINMIANFFPADARKDATFNDDNTMVIWRF